MIITRSPLRVSLGGGGTDLPSYYREHGGFLVAAAIDKYVYITQHRTFQEEIIVKYSKLERVASVDQIEHPIIREALKLTGVTDPHLELTSMADIPGGTGLGSSGSFTTALLRALHAYRKNLVSPAELAEQACDIELNRLGEPIGKQDQYIAAIGGITLGEALATRGDLTRSPFHYALLTTEAWVVARATDHAGLAHAFVARVEDQVGILLVQRARHETF